MTRRRPPPHQEKSELPGRGKRQSQCGKLTRGVRVARGYQWLYKRRLGRCRRLFAIERCVVCVLCVRDACDSGWLQGGGTFIVGLVEVVRTTPLFYVLCTQHRRIHDRAGKRGVAAVHKGQNFPTGDYAAATFGNGGPGAFHTYCKC